MRFGIVTHYYNSNNYGGNLQAYALCKFIEQNGYCVEQLCVPIDYYKKMHFPKQQIIDLKVWLYSLFNRLKYRDYIKNTKIEIVQYKSLTKKIYLIVKLSLI